MLPKWHAQSADALLPLNVDNASLRILDISGPHAGASLDQYARSARQCSLEPAAAAAQTNCPDVLSPAILALLPVCLLRLPVMPLPVLRRRLRGRPRRDWLPRQLLQLLLVLLQLLLPRRLLLLLLWRGRRKVVRLLRRQLGLPGHALPALEQHRLHAPAALALRHHVRLVRIDSEDLLRTRRIDEFPRRVSKSKSTSDVCSGSLKPMSYNVLRDGQCSCTLTLCRSLLVHLAG